MGVMAGSGSGYWLFANTKSIAVIYRDVSRKAAEHGSKSTFAGTDSHC